MFILSQFLDLPLTSYLSLSSPPIIQSTPQLTALFVYSTLFISFITYARFCTLVIRDITNFMGIACFTVRKMDSEGKWIDVQEDAPAAVEAREARDAKEK